MNITKEDIIADFAPLAFANFVKSGILTKVSQPPAVANIVNDDILTLNLPTK